MEKRVSKYTLILQEVEKTVRSYRDDESFLVLSIHAATIEKALREFRRFEYTLSNNHLDLENFGIDLTTWVNPSESRFCDHIPFNNILSSNPSNIDEHYNLRIKIRDEFATLIDSLRNINTLMEQTVDDAEYLNLYYDIIRKINFNPVEYNHLKKTYNHRKQRIIFTKSRGMLNKMRMEYIHATINEEWDNMFCRDLYLSRKEIDKYRKELVCQESDSLYTDKDVDRYAFFREFYDYQNGEYIITNEIQLARHFYVNRDILSEEMFRNHLSVMAMIGLIEEEMENAEKSGRQKYEGKLLSEEAEEYWKKLREAKIVNKNNQPTKLTWAEKAYLANALAHRLGIKNVWKEFGAYWGIDEEALRSAFNKGMESKRTGTFIEKINKILD